MRRAVCLLLPVTLVLAACQREPPIATEGTAAPSTATEGSKAGGTEGDGSDTVTMRYTCEAGHSVAIVGGGRTARVSLANGRVVDIPRVADAAPPRFSGEALSFDVGSGGATLGQHEVGGFACREAG